MQHRFAYRIAIIGLAIGAFAFPLVLLLTPQDAGGTDQYMIRLPTYLKFRCANCHATATPDLASKELNLFGKDFMENGFIWNQTLANKNSDKDRCTNGFELGDENGDGLVDQASTTVENSNPGNPDDCSIAISNQTWGIIKEIFRGGN
ncbi:MAG: hypothetical protein ABIA59_11095 [Candidatus Latescibacterota bacterium]